MPVCLGLSSCWLVALGKVSFLQNDYFWDCHYSGEPVICVVCIVLYYKLNINLGKARRTKLILTLIWWMSGCFVRVGH